jgi:4-amino-4-deoxy-L-arabinose transferase-like glycosyltransferase
VAVSTLVLASFLLVLPDRLSGNESADYSSFYRPVAENLVSGRGLLDSLDRPAVRYPPGYPAVLAVSFRLGDALGLDRSTAQRALDGTLWAAAAVAVFLLASSQWSRRGAWLATLAWTAYPLALWTAKQPNSELLFTPLLVLTFAVFWREARRAGIEYLPLLALGGLAGVTMLVRPAAIGLGLLLATLWLLIRRRQPRQRRALAGAAVIVLGNVLVIAPWELWAYRTTGEILPLSAGSTPSIRDGLTFGVRDKGYRQGTWIPQSTREFMERIHREAQDDQTVRAVLGEEQSSGDLIRIVARQIPEMPLGFSGLVMIKAARSWYGTDSQRFEGAILLVQLVFLTPAVIAIVICLRDSPERRQLALVTLGLVLYFWTMSIITLSIVRYMVPAYALMVATLPVLLPANRRRSAD